MILRKVKKFGFSSLFWNKRPCFEVFLLVFVCYVTKQLYKRKNDVHFVIPYKLYKLTTYTSICRVWLLCAFCGISPLTVVFQTTMSNAFVLNVCAYMCLTHTCSFSPKPIKTTYVLVRLYFIYSICLNSGASHRVYCTPVRLPWSTHILSTLISVSSIDITKKT